MLLVTLSMYNMQNSVAESGKATMYGGNINGNACGMDGTADAFGNWAYAAIGSNNFDSGYGCGNCYTITCIGPYGDNPGCSCSGSITVQAIDECPECSDSHFDLNAAALASLTGSSDMAGLCGVVEIDYERVDCSAISGNFNVINKEGTSIWWYGFHLNDVNDDGGIKSVELLKDGSWIATCTKDNGPSFWICNGLSANVPLDIKITSDLDKSVTAYNCITSLEGGAEMTCNTNLNGGSSSGWSDSSGSSSSIQIKQNSNSNEWWMAIEFPNSDNSAITKLELMDSNHASWISGSYEDWGTGAYSFNDGTQFSGNQHFRVTTSSGNAATSWNVFSGISGGSTAYISLAASSFTEEDDTNTSSCMITPIIAVLLILLSCLVIGVIIGYCVNKRRKEKSAVSFEDNNDGNKGEDSVPTIEDGDSTQSKASNAYDMNPIELETTV